MTFALFRFAALALCLVACLVASPVWAGSVFTVDKIKVDASAESTSQARALALRDGQQRALNIVLHRLTKQEEWQLLPKVESLNAEDWVEGFQVRGEKTAPDRYIARLSVQFKPAPLRRLLRRIGASITEVQSRPYLLLPVLENAQGLRAWGDNWWRASWMEKDLANNPAQLILPLGDLEDRRTISAQDILIGHPDKLQRLNRKYATKTIIVAHGLADIAGQFGVTLYIFAPNENDVVVRTYRTGQTHRQMASRAVDEVLEILAERWKNVAAITSDETTGLLIRTEFAGLRSWNKIRTKLSNVKLISNFMVSELSPDYAYLRIWHIGTAAQLIRNFAQNGLRLQQSGRGDWLVYLNNE